MKINDERTRTVCTFGSLSYGTCFIFKEKVFMVVNPTPYDNSNAVCLKTGELGLFDEDNVVISVEAELTIR